jgi:hypothetical protein
VKPYTLQNNTKYPGGSDIPTEMLLNMMRRMRPFGLECQFEMTLMRPPQDGHKRGSAS